MKNLEPFFKAKSIAVIGASHEEGKIGNVIFKLLLKHEHKRAVYPVNPNVPSVLGKKTFPSVLDISEKPEMAVIAVPAKIVPKTVNACGKKGIKHVIIISSGFKEVENKKLDKQLEQALKKHNILCIGPNCLGVLDTTSGIDTLFLPPDRLQRPKPGNVSFIAQSGAVCSTVLDLAASEGIGFAKVISYGNAMNLDESDYIEYLEQDPETKVICLYIEGVIDGKKFLEITKKSSKPIIVVKGGVTEAGEKATLSHTGALAGSPEIYLGAFKQANLVVARDIEEVFDFLKAFSTEKIPKGNRVQVITNGGGFGIITSDLVVEAGNLAMGGLSKKTITKLKKSLPPIAIVKNPLDVLGDATEERYELVLDECIKDKGNDALIVIALPQTPRLDLNKLAQIIVSAAKKTPKPVLVVATGSEPTRHFKKNLEERNVPCYDFPSQAVRALNGLVGYSEKKR